MATPNYTLLPANALEVGDTICHHAGADLTVRSIEDDRLGGLRFDVSSDGGGTATMCLQPTEIVRVRKVDAITDYWSNRRKHGG
jgi:hypothetical protein